MDGRSSIHQERSWRFGWKDRVMLWSGCFRNAFWTGKWSCQSSDSSWVPGEVIAGVISLWTSVLGVRMIPGTWHVPCPAHLPEGAAHSSSLMFAVCLLGLGRD